MDKLTRITSDITVADLEELTGAEAPATRRGLKKVPLQSIEVAPKAFQWRLPPQDDLEANPEDDERQVRELTRALETEGVPLEPLLVMEIGGRTFVIDGHHRLDAYHNAGWQHAVPVKWFDGSLFEARLAAMEQNRKNKLRMTDTSRHEAAWRLMKERTAATGPRLTWDNIVRVSGVSRGLLSKMKQSLENHGDAARDARSWRHARRLDWPDFTSDPGAIDEWLEREAAEKAKKLAAIPHFVHNAESTAMALTQLGLRGRLVDEWFLDAVERLVEFIREEGSEEDAATVEAIIGGLRGDPFSL